MRLKVVTRSGRELVAGGIELPNGAGVKDLIDTVHKLSKSGAKGFKTALYPSRQRYTVPASGGGKPVALASGKKLSDYGLDDGSSVTFKDLGPQIGYSTVFFWEYFGPLCVFLIPYFLPELVYGVAPEKQLAQTLASAYWTFHYAKRLLETWFVHEFSHGTMPIANLFRNCSYYWGFAALVSYFVNHPLYTSPPENMVYGGFAMGMVCQLGNFYSHIILKNLRKDGSKGYKIPKGFTFNYVTCSNYMWEVYGWASFNVATQSLMGVVFMICGAGQMMLWAAAKHKRLRSIFDGKEGRQKYPRRFIIFPPFF